jgi:hypothetical protein
MRKLDAAFANLMGAAVIGAMAAFAATASSAATLTQDKTAFDAATGGVAFSFEDFDALADESGLAVKDFGDFSVTSGDTFDITASVSFCRAGKCLFALDDSVAFSFDAPINALGFYLGAGNGAMFGVLVDSAFIGLISTPSSGYVFVGVYDLATPFSTVALPGEPGIFDIDDVSYGALEDTGPSNPVPLPPALPLFATGLGALGLFGWWRRRRAA